MSEQRTWRSRIVGHGEEAPDQLLASPWNWRIHPRHQQEALTGLLDEVGWVQDVIVSKNSGYVVDGHARVAIAISRREATVPVVYVDLTEAEEKKVLASFDPLGAMAGADKANLDALLQEVRTDDAALRSALRGLADDNGLAWGGDPPPGEAPEAEVDRAEELREKWGTAPGQLWTVGRHRLLCGDSTEMEQVGRLMQGEMADLVFTDPPYGVNVTGKGGASVAGDISFTLIPLMFDVIDKVLGPSGWCYVCGGQSNIMLYARLFDRYFRQLVRMVVWDKGRTAVLRHNTYHSCYELVYWAFREGGGNRWYGPRDSDHADDIWRIPVDADQDRDHVTQKPVALPARAIGNTCPPDGVVFEPFAGVGATFVASEQTGRRCYGMELEPKYVAVTLERLSKMGLQPQLSET